MQSCVWCKFALHTAATGQSVKVACCIARINMNHSMQTMKNQPFHSPRAHMHSSSNQNPVCFPCHTSNSLGFQGKTPLGTVFTYFPSAGGGRGTLIWPNSSTTEHAKSARFDAPATTAVAATRTWAAMIHRDRLNCHF